jgi:hypothetical protein
MASVKPITEKEQKTTQLTVRSGPYGILTYEVPVNIKSSEVSKSYFFGCFMYQ